MCDLIVESIPSSFTIDSFFLKCEILTRNDATKTHMFIISPYSYLISFIYIFFCKGKKDHWIQNNNLSSMSSAITSTVVIAYEGKGVKKMPTVSYSFVYCSYLRHYQTTRVKFSKGHSHIHIFTYSPSYKIFPDHCYCWRYWAGARCPCRQSQPDRCSGSQGEYNILAHESIHSWHFSPLNYIHLLNFIYCNLFRSIIQLSYIYYSNLFHSRPISWTKMRWSFLSFANRIVFIWSIQKVDSAGFHFS